MHTCIIEIGPLMCACSTSFARELEWRACAGSMMSCCDHYSMWQRPTLILWPLSTLRTCPLPRRIKKKEGTRHWSAQRASLGARSLKPGHTRFFVGYKKHTLRLWIRAYEPAVLLVPLVSWAAPAHVPEGYLLKPSLHYCHQRLHWQPAMVTGDLGYIHQPTKKEIRERWQIAVVTKLKSDMNIVEPFDDWNQMSCAQGQPLHWLGYECPQQVHWFGVPPGASLCSTCWEASHCGREFAYPAALHESLLGLLPLNTIVASKLLTQVRSWIEPTQAFEKNILGVGRVFLNGLRLAWTVSLLADAVALLRAQALLTTKKTSPLLQRLLPKQLNLGLTDFD